MRRIAPFALALLLATGTAACAQAPQAPSDVAAEAPLTLETMRLHDPFIVADKKTRTYYLFTSNIEEASGDKRVGTMLYTSKDLRHWTRPKLVFTVPEGIWGVAGAWAPEVHQWQGKWYLFTTLHNEALTLPQEGKRSPYRRGTILAVADKPEGPYRVVRNGEPIVPASDMTLDGHLYVENGKPWLVYAHEWVQTTDGTMEAVPLDETLAVAGPPKLLFRASDAPWVKGQPQSGPDDLVYVTDGPWLHRTKTGKLVMLWSSYGADGYNQAQARSTSGTLDGPWEQLPPLVGGSSGHGMLFRTFEGQLMMVLHRPFGAKARGKLYEIDDSGDALHIIRQRIDLDGDAR
ncbi:glycoside hydrolase family 43 protein [Pedomonas mirosovicensis]|uniref:glycoside hydrolase family 43 protein n=1 Tax=Pedomonas mirosovicensis TaxID=2908641 RepID=UPI002167241F|nr:glycoside hydrolase family 43 protein [Pedomonas mirosovicensis]MCH8686186.1 glycoside hydrolase family 43 protein [Pedomonas mirosovicensis]